MEYQDTAIDVFLIELVYNFLRAGRRKISALLYNESINLFLNWAKIIMYL